MTDRSVESNRVGVESPLVAPYSNVPYPNHTKRANQSNRPAYHLLNLQQFLRHPPDDVRQHGECVWLIYPFRPLMTVFAVHTDIDRWNVKFPDHIDGDGVELIDEGRFFLNTSISLIFFMKGKKTAVGEVGKKRLMTNSRRFLLRCHRGMRPVLP